MGDFQQARRVLGEEAFATVQGAKVFMCGAGGIGCELLKCLVLSGFRHVDVIDMDTVDSSNLNRQFLFRERHVNCPKSEVARETALKYADGADITAHYGNVKDDKFDAEFFKRFDIVVNGLDNRSARSHVNRMAMKAGVPLIESGTMGYNGQVQPIVKDRTQCYDCNPKQTGQVSFAVCTIHQKPSTMVHCTHYAKELYKRFFGEEVSNDPEMEFLSTILASSSSSSSSSSSCSADDDSGAGAAAADAAVPPPPPREAVVAVFDAIFGAKIRELIDLKQSASSYTDTTRPRPLSFAALGEAEEEEKAAAAAAAAAAGSGGDGASSACALESQRVLGLSELGEAFVAAFEGLWTRPGGKRTWDKDDDLALQLTVAVANLRAHNFRIKRESEFAIKSLAGNIIPAIATSNAVISGGIVLEAIKVLTGKTDRMRIQSLRRFPARIKRKDCYIVPEVPPGVNPDCYVCQSGRNLMHVRLNMSKTTVRFVVDALCGHELAMEHPMVSLSKGEDERLVYEDEEMTENAAKVLAAFLGEQPLSGWSLLLEDMLQELTAELSLTHDASLDPADYVLSGEKPEEKKGTAKADGDAETTAAVDDSEGEEEVFVYHPRKKTAGIPPPSLPLSPPPLGPGNANPHTTIFPPHQIGR